MKRVARRLSYGNVVATLALFLALTGGVVWAAHKIRSNQIARSAVKTRNIAKSAVTAVKVKNGSLQRADLGDRTISGLPVAEASAANIAVPAAGAPVAIPLQGDTPFTARVGRASSSATATAGLPKELLVEARGTLASNTGNPGDCDANIRINVNGLEVAAVAPRDDNPIDSNATAVGLTQSGQSQTLAATIDPNSNCAAGSRIDSLRIVVVQYG